MITSDLPLLAIWMRTGELDGEYWFVDESMPPELKPKEGGVTRRNHSYVPLKRRASALSNARTWTLL